MADKTSAVMNYVDSIGGKGSKTITDVSPTAALDAVANFARALNSLTTNTIASIELVERTDITDGGSEKAAPIIQWGDINPDNVPLSEVTHGGNFDITVYISNATFEGTAHIPCFAKGILAQATQVYFNSSINPDSKFLSIHGYAVSEYAVIEKEYTILAGDKVVVQIPESTTTTAATVTLTFGEG